MKRERSKKEINGRAECTGWLECQPRAGSMPAEPCKTSELGTTGESLGMENHVGRALTPFRTKAMATPPTEPIKTSRATLESRQLPERMRIQEISISGQRRRT